MPQVHASDIQGRHEGERRRRGLHRGQAQGSQPVARRGNVQVRKIKADLRKDEIKKNLRIYSDNMILRHCRGNGKSFFRHRESNPGLLGESQLS